MAQNLPASFKCEECRRIAKALRAAWQADNRALRARLRDVAVSSGSACTSASVEASYVLRACGVPQALAESSIRFGLGRFNTEEEVNYVGQLVVDKVRDLRKAKQDLAPQAAAV